MAAHVVVEEGEPSHHELQAESREKELEIEEVFKHSAPASSDTLPPTRPPQTALPAGYWVPSIQMPDTRGGVYLNQAIILSRATRACTLSI